MSPDELLAQATCRIFVNGDFRGIGSLIGEDRFVLTAAEILNRAPARGLIEVAFGGDRPRPAMIIDEELGLDYAVLKIMGRPEDRQPLAIGTGRLGLRRILVGGFEGDHPDIPLTRAGRVMYTAPAAGKPGSRMLLIDTDDLILMPGAPVLDLEGTDNAIIGFYSPLVRAENIGLENPQFVVPLDEIIRTSNVLRSRTSDVLQVEELRYEAIPAAKPAEPLRYPTAEFYSVSGAVETRVPASDCLPEIIHPAWLEFRFRLDVQKSGIPYKGDIPYFHKPPTHAYPLDLDVDVWSADLRFATSNGFKPRAQQKISLTAEGPSSTAKFRIVLPLVNQQKEIGVLFVFLRHQQILLAGFRIEVSLTDHDGNTGQSLEHIYLSEKWFSMPGKAQSAALTIYVRNEENLVYIFAFSGATAMWTSTNSSAEGFRDLTTRLYLKIGELAEEGGRLTFARKATDLALLGYQIFSALFFAQYQPVPRQVLGDLSETIRELPEGSEIIIATDPSSQAFVVPWGLVYHDREQLSPVSGLAKADCFWGLRFRLSVQPSVVKAWLPEAEGVGMLKSIGKVYETHVKAKRMSAMLQFLQEREKIAKAVGLAITDNSIPELTKQAFDYLHFFCHGYTELQNQELATQISNHSNPQLMYSPAAPYGSHIKTIGGIATLAKLQEAVPRLAGSPIVQLSMCQSAQISASGKSFVTFFLERGARAVVGTEGPNPWKLARNMDTRIICRLLKGKSVTDAVWEARKKLAKKNVLALIYIVYGDGNSRLNPSSEANQIKT
jgi:hypothetical protein